MESAGSQARKPTRTGPAGPPAIEPGAVRLRVADISAARDFYERAIGLEVLGETDDVVRLGADRVPAVELAASPDAGPRPPGTTGLFHMAILVPGRAALAQALARLAGVGWRLSGASNHLVSEALYLNDSEGNGIEIYRDCPRSEWRYDGGSLQMATLPLDLDSLLGELPDSGSADPVMPPGTRIGHVHLNVADIGQAEDFYANVLGFDVTVRAYPGALFLSTGGYHHHIGVNTWAGPGAPPPPQGSRGLMWFELTAGTEAAVDELRARLEAAGAEAEEMPGAFHTTDPSGNGVLIRAPSA